MEIGVSFTSTSSFNVAKGSFLVFTQCIFSLYFSKRKSESSNILFLLKCHQFITTVPLFINADLQPKER